MNIDSDSSSLVRLDVGGKIFRTRINTLTQRDPNSKLAAMFSSGNHALFTDEEGYVYIDRDGEYFTYILKWLRDGRVPTLEDSKYLELLEEAEYFELEGLISGIHDRLQKNKKEKELVTDLTRRDIIKYKLINQAHRLREPRFRGVNLSGLDLSGLELSQINFDHVVAKGANFTDARLENSSFNGAKLQGANFSNATLESSLFEDANLEGANFNKANLGSCLFNKANLRRANFNNANFQSSSRFHETNLQGASFNNANLGSSYFYEANLQGTTFNSANLESSYFHEANLQGADFNYAKLGSSEFIDANLKQASVVGIQCDEGCIPFSGCISPPPLH